MTADYCFVFNANSFKNMPVALIFQFFKTRSGSLLSLKDFFPNAGKVKFWGKRFAFCHKKFMGQKVKSVPNKVCGRRISKRIKTKMIDTPSYQHCIGPYL